MIEFLQNNWIEVTGTMLSLFYLYFSIKEKLSLWVFGFLSALFYAVVFYNAKFYADMSLQFYYLAVSVFGFVSWKFGHQHNTKQTLLIRTSTFKHLMYLFLSAFAIFLLYYFVLVNFTDSPIPIADSVTTALSIVATWMLARKRIEHWLLWIFIDAFSAVLYVQKGLYTTAVLFFIYTIMAIVGYFSWRKLMLK